MNEILAANLRYYLLLCGTVSVGGSLVVGLLAWWGAQPAPYPCRDCGAWNAVSSPCPACAALYAEAQASGLLAVWAAAKADAIARGYRDGLWRSHVLGAVRQAGYRHPATRPQPPLPLAPWWAPQRCALCRDALSLRRRWQDRRYCRACEASAMNGRCWYGREAWEIGVWAALYEGFRGRAARDEAHKWAVNCLIAPAAVDLARRRATTEEAK